MIWTVSATFEVDSPICWRPGPPWWLRKFWTCEFLSLSSGSAKTNLKFSLKSKGVKCLKHSLENKMWIVSSNKTWTPNLFSVVEGLPKLFILRKLYDFGFRHKLRWQGFAHFWPPTHPQLTFAKQLLFWNKVNLQAVDIFSTTYVPSSSECHPLFFTYWQGRI